MKTNWQDPQTSKVISPHISGMQESLGKIEDGFNLTTMTDPNIQLSEVYISPTNRYRIFQAPLGKRNWVENPAPIIKKNGIAITTGFTIEYGGGAIVLSTNALSSDKFTAEATYTTNEKIKDLVNKVSALYSATLTDSYIYGVQWDKTSNPVLTRTDRSIGAIVNVGINSEIVDNSMDISGIFKDFREVTDKYGNVFIRIPKMYIKKSDTTELFSRKISRKKFDGSYLPWCFWDFVNNKELDYIDVGKHKASLSDDGTKLESKPGKYPLINKTIVNFRTYAKNNGNEYQQLDIHTWDLLQTLFVIEQATLHSQSIVAGYTSGQYSASHIAIITEIDTNRIIVSNSVANNYEIGQAISVGTSLGGNQIFYGRNITDIQVYDVENKAIVFDGPVVNITAGNILYNTGYKNGFSNNIVSSVGSINSKTSGKHPFVWHEIESLFGDIWQFVDGVNINDNQAWVCEDARNYASNIFTAPYKQVGYMNSNIDGYVKKLGFDPNIPYIQFPVEVGGSASTYYSDNYYQSLGQRIARVGGPWCDGSDAGLFYWNLNISSSNTNVYVGGRLLKKAL